jgi:hypothetical protein
MTRLFDFGRYDAGREAVNDGIAQIPEKWVGAKQCLLVEKVILANSPHIRFHQTSFQQTLQYDKIARRGSILPEKAKNKSPKK